MPTKIRAAVIEQIELFRPLPRRPVWSSLPQSTKQELRRLLAQMLTARAQERGDVKARKERSDD